MQSLAEPKTIYGYLAAALIERSQSDNSPLTIMCCDNLQGGGEFLAKGTLALIEQHNKACLMWVNKNVNFIASMVDRVTPATDDNLIHQVTEQLAVEDKSPIAAEPFSQWVIEDNFAGKKPAFDKVGANFVVDITEYEQMKLRFLNASHSIIAALGYLFGDTYIHQALKKVEVLSFTKQALLENILPFTTIPQDAGAYQYIEQIIERFQNSALPYGVLQVGTDSSQKIVQRWFPTIDDALNKNHNTSFFAFVLAAWALYIEQAISNKELNDPLLAEFTKALAETREISVKSLLILTGAENFNFFKNIVFINKVEEYKQLMSERGIATALKLFLN
jgi:fructuronate reductase